MLGQSECVIVDLLAQAADVVPDLVLYLGQLLLGLLCHLHHIELRVNITCDSELLHCDQLLKCNTIFLLTGFWQCQTNLM